MTDPVRVRFAPSPTGYLHVGGARTALFNWLYARKTGGTFILRIEDTDVERSSWDMVEGILEGLRWLGLDWDEGPGVGGPHAPYFQSERLERYRVAADGLVTSGHAYYCFCNPDELKAKRAQAEADDADGQYDRACLRLPDEERARLTASDAPRAVRFRVPDGATTIPDIVHGPIDIDHAHIEDFVILRSDRHPTYHLTVVVDDVDMRITHVVRGDDHISNTPKQMLLYRALGAAPPLFAHVPLILGPDKRRLSKRHGATAVGEYKTQGILAAAMVNFLALLGWSPGNDEEVLTRAQLVDRFTLEGITSSNAVFNPEKLEWFNGQHIQRLSDDELLEGVTPVLHEAGLWRESFAPEGSDRSWLLAVARLFKPRVRKLAEVVTLARYLLADDFPVDAAAVAKHLSQATSRELLAALAEAYRALPTFEKVTLESTLRATAEGHAQKAGPLIHAARVAATGQGSTPGLFDVLELLGRDRVLARFARALASVP